MCSIYSVFLNQRKILHITENTNACITTRNPFTFTAPQLVSNYLLDILVQSARLVYGNLLFLSYTLCGPLEEHVVQRTLAYSNTHHFPSKTTTVTKWTVLSAGGWLELPTLVPLEVEIMGWEIAQSIHREYCLTEAWQTSCWLMMERCSTGASFVGEVFVVFAHVSKEKERFLLVLF